MFLKKAGQVVRWSSGQVVRWSGGQVVRWSGGQFHIWARIVILSYVGFQ